MDYHEAFDEPSGRRSHHYYSSTTSSSSSSSSTWTTTLASWLDLLTGPNFGIFVAVIVVIIMQYKGTLTNLYYDNWQQDGWQGIVDVLFRQKETLRAYYQMACEFVRSWREDEYDQFDDPQRRTRRTGLSLLRTTSSSAMPPPLVLPEEEEEEEGRQVPSAIHNGKHHHHKDHRNNNNNRLSVATTNNNNSNGNHNHNLQSSSSSLLPELDPSSPLLQKRNGVAVCQQTSRRRPQQRPQPELEPAFLNEQDYPPGWLVYHPVLGVVPKEQADQYGKSSSHGGGGMPIELLSSSISAAS
jgi:hypothetical protein